MHNMMVADAKAVVAFHEGDFEGEIGIVQNLEPKYPLDPNNAADCEAARMADVINNRWVLDATFRGHYAADTMEAATKLAHIAGGELDVRDEDIAALTAALPYNDCLGVNTYKCQFLRAAEGENDINHNGTGDKGSSRWFLKGVGESCVREGVPTTDWDWIIYPEGLYDLLLRIKNDYPNYKKIYITENGMGYKDDFEDGFIDDAPRIDYMRQHLAWILKAIDGGVNVDGYFVWSLQQFSWTRTATTSATACSTSTSRPRSAIPRRARTGTRTSRRPACSWPSFCRVPPVGRMRIPPRVRMRPFLF